MPNTESSTSSTGASAKNLPAAQAWQRPVARAADAVELWMVESGALDQLAFLVAKTGFARNAVLFGASWLLSRGVLHGSLPESLVGALATVIVGTVNFFISRVRNKYAAMLQHAVGVQADKFVGPETVAEVAKLVIRDANAAPTSAPSAPDPSTPTTNTP